jgi:peptidoglycan/LPS O-acetylase OafA/YrhL
MIRLLRRALQLVAFLLLLSLVVALAGEYTGPVEKVVLVAMGVAVVWLAARVRRIGEPRPSA